MTDWRPPPEYRPPSPAELGAMAHAQNQRAGQAYQASQGTRAPRPFQPVDPFGQVPTQSEVEDAKAKVAEWDKAALTSLAHSSRIARVARVLRAAASQSDNRPGRPTIEVNLDLLHRLLPDEFPTVFPYSDLQDPGRSVNLVDHVGRAAAAQQRRSFSQTEMPWSDDEVARWFAGASREPASPLPVYVWIRRKLRKVEVLGWRFRGGSTQTETVAGEHLEFATAAVTTKGRRIYAGNTYEPDESRLRPNWCSGADRLNVMTLAKMADLAMLEPLPAEPLWIDVGVLPRHIRPITALAARGT